MRVELTVWTKLCFLLRLHLSHWAVWLPTKQLRTGTCRLCLLPKFCYCCEMRIQTLKCLPALGCYFKYARTIDWTINVSSPAWSLDKPHIMQLLWKCGCTYQGMEQIGNTKHIRKTDHGLEYEVTWNGTEMGILSAEKGTWLLCAVLVFERPKRSFGFSLLNSKRQVEWMKQSKAE